jgi:uncharacterized membrane protein YdjX (TVP38/TMEM64 family)
MGIHRKEIAMTATDTGASTGKSGPWLKLGILLLVVAGGFIALRYTPLSAYVEPNRLKAFFDSIAQTWWAPLLYVAVYAGGTPLGMPGSVLTILGGLTFGTVYGSLYVLVGANIGANLAFGLARSLGRDAVARFVKGPVDAIDRQLRDQGFLRILQLRLIPVVPFNLLNFVSGLSGIRHTHYMFGTLIGMIPGIFVYVYSASALAQLYFAGAGVQDEAARAAARATALTSFGLAVALLVLVSSIPYLYRRFRG